MGLTGVGQSARAWLSVSQPRPRPERTWNLHSQGKPYWAYMTSVRPWTSSRRTGWEERYLPSAVRGGRVSAKP